MFYFFDFQLNYSQCEIMAYKYFDYIFIKIKMYLQMLTDVT